MATEHSISIQKVGVVGCGLMGAGIVEVCARKGLTVVFREISDDLVAHGSALIKKSLDRALERGKLSAEEHAATLARIQGTTAYDDMADCDLVIEAVIENLGLKTEVFSKLDQLTPPHAILASNTSSLSITSLAAATRRPDRVIGMHFFNPVPVMPLLELVLGLQTSQETLATARRLGEALGKTIVVAAKDNPGFIVNLLFVPYALDAIRALEQGVASKEDIDTAMKLGMNHPMGPFELMDFVGLDTMLFIADAMFGETRDARYAAPPLLRRMVTAGRYGRKAGLGFYDYRK